MCRRYCAFPAESRPQAARRKAQTTTRNADCLSQYRYRGVPDMTCNELRDRVETSSFRSLDESSRGAEFAGHIECCSACRRWIETEEQLRSRLRLMRDDAP